MTNATEDRQPEGMTLKELILELRTDFRAFSEGMNSRMSAFETAAKIATDMATTVAGHEARITAIETSDRVHEAIAQDRRQLRSLIFGTSILGAIGVLLGIILSIKTIVEWMAAA